VAIRGGHEHALRAVAAGAVAVLAEAGRASSLSDVPTLAVAPDTVTALGAIGADNRARAVGCDVVGITGSVGKTSTKDILAALLRPQRRLIASPHGYNNEIGLPLTLCRIDPDTELAVCELAMRGPGQIAALCALARPRVGVVTNVSAVHIELLGSLEAIARAKAELLQALPVDGVAVLPHDDPLLGPHRRRDLETVTFGTAAGADVRLVSRTAGPDGSRLSYRVRGRPLELRTTLPGQHQAVNLAAALAACEALGVAASDVVPPILDVELARWRGETHALPGGAVVINDAWNAGPASMRAALATLAERAVAGRRIAVLGEMAELGPISAAMHREVGAAAVEAGVDVLVAVGERARGYLDGAAGGVEAHWLPDPAELVPLVHGLVRPGDAVLVKASRSVGLEGVAAGLVAAGTNDGR
jgi:UDP-N-acetylmuramoyl-tripeptide--D-alanyl-D-alanine ligase